MSSPAPVADLTLLVITEIPDDPRVLPWVRMRELSLTTEHAQEIMRKSESERKLWARTLFPELPDANFDVSFVGEIQAQTIRTLLRGSLNSPFEKMDATDRCTFEFNVPAVGVFPLSVAQGAAEITRIRLRAGDFEEVRMAVDLRQGKHEITLVSEEVYFVKDDLDNAEELVERLSSMCELSVEETVSKLIRANLVSPDYVYTPATQD